MRVELPPRRTANLPDDIKLLQLMINSVVETRDYIAKMITPTLSKSPRICNVVLDVGYVIHTTPPPHLAAIIELVKKRLKQPHRWYTFEEWVASTGHFDDPPTPATFAHARVLWLEDLRQELSEMLHSTKRGNT